MTRPPIPSMTGPRHNSSAVRSSCTARARSPAIIASRARRARARNWMTSSWSSPSAARYPGPSVSSSWEPPGIRLRSSAIIFWIWCRALLGGSASQTASTSRLIDTTRLASNSRSARARFRSVPPSRSGASSYQHSRAPRMRNTGTVPFSVPISLVLPRGEITPAKAGQPWPHRSDLRSLGAVVEGGNHPSPAVPGMPLCGWEMPVGTTSAPAVFDGEPSGNRAGDWWGTLGQDRFVGSEVERCDGFGARSRDRAR